MADIILRNGKKLSDALRIVAEKKEPTKLLQDKYPYFKHSEYVERFDEAFGADGYEAIYSNFQIYPLPLPVNDKVTAAQVIVKTDCTISIFGENGEVVLRASGVGTKELGRDKTKVSFQGVNNVGLFVQQSAFKSAAKSLNIFDSCYDENGVKDNSLGDHQTGSASSGKGKPKGNTTKEVKKITFYVKKPMEKIRDDAQTGKPVYRLIAHEVVNNACREKEWEVLFYPNCYKNATNQVNDLLMGQLPRKVTLSVSDVAGQGNDAYDKSFVFKGFAGGN